jgi:predicted N-acetyltransferase YhbS
MENIEIDRLRPSDLREIDRLHKTRPELEGNESLERTQILKWIAFSNPQVTDQDTTYFVARNQERIVAYHGRMPTIFNIQGKKVKGYYVHDLYVDPEYRNKGMGLMLTLTLAKAIEDQSDSFICLFGMTSLNLQIQRRRKYLELDMAVFSRSLRPEPVAAMVTSNKWLGRILSLLLGLALKVFDLITLKLGAGGSKYKVRVVQEFDQEMLDFTRKINHKIGVSSYKSGDLFNWKYVAGPFQRSHILIITHNNEIQGLAVLSKSTTNGFKIGRVLELLIDPENSQATTALLKQIMLYFKQHQCHIVKCVMNNTQLQKHFKRLGFIHRSNAKLLLGNLDKTNHGEHLRNPVNWYMSLGESDSRMFLR